MSLYLHSKGWKQLVFFFLLCSTFISVHLRSKACLCCRWTMNEFDNPGLQCSHFKAGQTLTFDTKVFFAVGVTNYRVNVSRAIFVTSSAAVAKGEFVYLCVNHQQLLTEQQLLTPLDCYIVTAAVFTVFAVIV